MGKSHDTELEREFLFLTEQKAKKNSVLHAQAISELP